MVTNFCNDSFKRIANYLSDVVPINELTIKCTNDFLKLPCSALLRYKLLSLSVVVKNLNKSKEICFF